MFSRPILSPLIQVAVSLLPIFSLNFSSLLRDIDDNKNLKYEEKSRVHTSLPIHNLFKNDRPFDSDPIKFLIKSANKTVKPGEEIDIVITAYYLNISPTLLFSTPGSNAFRIKLLMPDGFVQTGGDFTDYTGTELSADKPVVTYTLKGRFLKAGSTNDFRLLRSHANADANSLFIEKGRLSIAVVDETLSQSKNARVSACSVTSPNAVLDFADCNGIGGWALDQATMSQPVTIDIYIDGVKTYADITANGDRQDLVGAFGNTAARYHGFSYSFPANAYWKNGQNHTVSVRICGTNDDVNGSPKTVNGCTGGTTNPTANNCPFSEGQFLFNFYGEQIYAHYYNGILFAAYQDASQGFKPQSWIQEASKSVVFDQTKVSCFATSDPRSTTPPPSTGGGNGNGLQGNYFNNINLSGSPVMARTDATVNFTWNEGNSSFPGVNATNMSVRWEGQVEAPVSGDFTFSTNNDDATNLWVNGQQLINDWPGGHGPILKSGTISLQAGQKYSIRLEFNQGAGGAQAQLLWAYPGQGQQIIPQGRLYSSGTTINPTPSTISNSNCGTGSGLTGFYCNSSDLSQNLIAIRTDAQINFVWEDSPMPGTVNADAFSVRWFGQIEAPVSGNYTFKTNNDDGSRIWINGDLLINDWNGHAPTWQQGNIYLNAGQKYDVTIDFADFGGGAQAQLYWEYPGQNLQIIPSCRLYPLPTSNQSDAKIGTVKQYQLDNLTIRTNLTGEVYSSNLSSWPWPKNPTRCPNLSPKIPKTPKPERPDSDDNDCGNSGGGTGGSPFGPVPTYVPINEPPVPTVPVGGGGPGSGSPTDSPVLTGTRIPTTAFLDAIDCDKISGWAFANSGGYAYLDIYAPDLYSTGTDRMVKVATIKANNASRPDVRAAFGNNPNIPLDCGFVWAIPDAYKNGHPLTIKVVPVNDISPIGNSPMTTSGNCEKPVTPGGTTGPWKPSLLPEVLQISKFYIYMTNLGINFSDEERAVIAEYNLYESIKAYVDQYGSKPDGSRTFILSDVDQQKYPRFTELLKGMLDFVEQHDRVKQALIRHTKLSWDKIKPMLKFGSGPKIVISELSPSSYYGHTVYPAFPEPFIEVSARYVRGLEAANLTATRESTAFLLTVTLLHELTHYGAVDGGRNESRNDEFGDDFEREVLGTTISKNNAGQLLIYFNKLN